MLGDCVLGDWARTGTSQIIELLALPLGDAHRPPIAA
jgi:hypothetical protein